MTEPETPVDGYPPVSVAWSVTELPRGILVELTDVVRATVAFVTVIGTRAEVEGW